MQISATPTLNTYPAAQSLKKAGPVEEMKKAAIKGGAAAAVAMTLPAVGFKSENIFIQTLSEYSTAKNILAAGAMGAVSGAIMSQVADSPTQGLAFGSALGSLTGAVTMGLLTQSLDGAAVGAIVGTVGGIVGGLAGSIGNTPSKTEP